MKDRLLGVTGFFLFIAALSVLAGIAALLFPGTTYITKHLFPAMKQLSGLMIFASIVMLVIAMVPSLRGWAGAVLYLSSYCYGALIWFAAFIVTYSVWGVTGLILGIALFGIGVVPIAILACMLHSHWEPLFLLVAGLILAVSCRGGGVMLVENDEERAAADYYL